MKTLLKLLVLSALLLVSGILFAASATDPNRVHFEQDEIIKEPVYYGEEVKIVEKAHKTLEKSVLAMDHFMQDPENSIPPSLISQSEAIVIFPEALKLALGVAGGQGGRGILMIRQDSGSWSNPFFVLLGEGSLGLQFGAISSEIVLLFKDKNDLKGIDQGEITLGSDVGVAAGPVSKGSSATSDVTFETEIYSYYRSKGLYAGISLKGGVLTCNNRVNETLYCKDDVSTDEIFNEIDTPYNERVSALIDVLDRYSE